MKHLNPLLTLLFVAAIAVSSAVADSPCSDSEDAPVGFDNTACKSTIPFGAGVTPVPLVDGSTTTLYGTTSEIVSLYGNFGVTDERSSGSDAGAAHYSQGVTLANQIAPLCSDGTVGGPNGCTDGKPKKIVFLFLGFSNCDVEICGGHVDAWDLKRKHAMPMPLPQLIGQPCATKCPNLGNPQGGFAYNVAARDGVSDGYDQLSLLRLVYPPTGPSLVGPSVVVFNGALGQQALDKWDPTSMGYFWTNDCPYDHFTNDNPECNYYRVADDLQLNKFTEAAGAGHLHQVV